jgi:uncharacterized spore protein YtfJ
MRTTFGRARIALMSDQTFVERIAAVIQTSANARQIFGDPVERDGATIIPVARVQWGFGGGALGHGIAERGGGGGGARATAIGYIEVRDGASSFKPIYDPGDVATLILASLAGVLLGITAAKLLR